MDVGGTAKIFESVRITVGDNYRFAGGKTEAFSHASLANRTAALVHEPRGDVDSAACAVVLVVVDDQGTFVPAPVGVGEDVFVDVAVAVPEIVQREVGTARKDMPPLQQRCNLALVARDQILVRPLIHLRLFELHAVALAIAFNLAMPQHRQPRSQERHVGKESRYRWS